MLKFNATKRDIVCWLIGGSLLPAISKGELYIVKTASGAEVRRVSDQQPILYTGKYSIEELETAITNPNLGWRYCEASPEDKEAAGTYKTDVKLCVLVAPNEGFKLLGGPGPIDD